MTASNKALYDVLIGARDQQEFAKVLNQDFDSDSHHHSDLPQGNVDRPVESTCHCKCCSSEDQVEPIYALKIEVGTTADGKPKRQINDIPVCRAITREDVRTIYTGNEVTQLDVNYTDLTLSEEELIKVIKTLFHTERDLRTFIAALLMTN